MGELEEFCAICGGPSACSASSCAATLNRSFDTSTEWLDDWCGVTPEQPEQPISIGKYTFAGCFECSCFRAGCDAVDSSHIHLDGTADTFATFSQWHFHIIESPDVSLELHGSTAKSSMAPAAGLHLYHDQWVRYGVAFHRACGQVLQQRLGYAINFNHIWPLLQQQYEEQRGVCGGYLFRHDYGGTEKYYSQFFDTDMLPEDEHLLMDPRQCRGNADRIVRVWEPLVQRFTGGTAAAATAGTAAATAHPPAAGALACQSVTPAPHAQAATGSPAVHTNKVGGTAALRLARSTT